MVRSNPKDVSFKEERPLNNRRQLQKIMGNGNSRLYTWLRGIKKGKFNRFSVITFILSVHFAISLSTQLAVAQSPATKPLAADINNESILVRQEFPQEEAQPEESFGEEVQPEESFGEEVQPEESFREEIPSEEPSREEVQPEESFGEEAQPEESSREESEPEGASREEVGSEESSREESEPEGASREEVGSEESSREESEPEESSREESEPEESSREESEPEGEGEGREEEVPFEEAKETLEEAINERYEEWEAQKTSSEISHSVSAIATIVMTVIIAMLGTGLFPLPYAKLVMIVLATVSVLTQLHLNVFLLDESLAGYEVVEKQGSILREKLETARTSEEVNEIREQFEELAADSIAIE